MEQEWVDKVEKAGDEWLESTLKFGFTLIAAGKSTKMIRDFMIEAIEDCEPFDDTSQEAAQSVLAYIEEHGISFETWAERHMPQNGDPA